GRTPMCEVHENLLSFAMVEAAVASIDHGGRIEIDELLEQARVEAIAAETDERARELMQSWSSVREALLAGQGDADSPARQAPPMPAGVPCGRARSDRRAV